MPFYWKRGLFAGLAIGLIMSFLVQRLDPTMSIEQATANHHTPFGPLMGVIVFALFCIMPGAPPEPVGAARKR